MVQDPLFLFLWSKLNMVSSYDEVVCHMNVRSGLIPQHPNLEAIQLSLSRWKDTYTDVLLCLRGVGTQTSCPWREGVGLWHPGSDCAG